MLNCDCSLGIYNFCLHFNTGPSGWVGYSLNVCAYGFANDPFARVFVAKGL